LTGPSGREDLHPKKSEVQAKTADKREEKKEKEKKKKKKRKGKGKRDGEEAARIRAAFIERKKFDAVDQHQCFRASR
jgi:ribosomal protein L19E